MPSPVYGDIRHPFLVCIPIRRLHFRCVFAMQQLIVMTVNGLIQGCLFTGSFNYGAGNRDRLHSAFRYETALGLRYDDTGTLTVIPFPAQLGLFTASEAMRSFGISAMRTRRQAICFGGLSTMISTYFRLDMKVGSSIVIQLCRQLLFLVPFYGVWTNYSN